ncbi:MAG: hypothetical protein RIE08_12640 [Acidimicrobiales bacterium]
MIDERSPLATLLWVDEQYHCDESLPDCFGDSYLVALNPVFRGVRLTAREMGVRFVDRPDALGHRYRSAPLTALAAILASGTVPYAGDVATLREIAASGVPVAADANELRLFFSGHVVMHESAHLVADRIFSEVLRTGPDIAPVEATIAALLGEAVANTTETLGGLHATHGTHQLLYSWNSLSSGKESTRAALRALVARHGMKIVFGIAMWIYFHQNLIAHTNACPPTYMAACGRSVFDGTDVPAADRQVAVTTCAAMLELNPGARETTTPAYFRLSGTEEDFRTAASLDLGDRDVIDALGIAAAITELTARVSEWLVDPADMAS